MFYLAWLPSCKCSARKIRVAGKIRVARVFSARAETRRHFWRWWAVNPQARRRVLRWLSRGPVQRRARFRAIARAPGGGARYLPSSRWPRRRWDRAPPLFCHVLRGVISSLRAKAVDAFSSRDFPAARDALRRLARLEPDNPSWREALGQCYVDAGEESDFASAAEEFGKLQDDWPPTSSRGPGYSATGRSRGRARVGGTMPSETTTPRWPPRTTPGCPGSYVLNSRQPPRSLGEYGRGRSQTRRGRSATRGA